MNLAAAPSLPPHHPRVPAALLHRPDYSGASRLFLLLPPPPEAISPAALLQEPWQGPRVPLGVAAPLSKAFLT